jgi:hypothetical protein
MITIPTISQLYTSIINDIQAQYNITIPFFGKNILRVIAGVQAAKLKLLYLVAGSLQKNIAPDTADPEASGGTLERFGRLKLGRNPFPAVAGFYEVIVTGDIGATIPAGTVFKSDDETSNPGYLFILDVAFTMASQTETIDLRALTPGQISQLQPGDTLTSTAPLNNINDQVEVYAEIVEPFDAEDIEDYRDKVVAAYRLEAQGGAGTDYRLWAQDAQGVLRVYPYAKNGFPNEIELFVEATVTDSIDGKGTPSAGLLADVEDVVEFNPDDTIPLLERGRRPITVFNIDFLPITALDVDITINGFVGLTVEKQANITAALENLIKNIRPFAANADIIENQNDVLDVNKIIGAIISVYPGAVFTSVQLEVNSVIVSTYTFTFGDIPYFNSINFA